MNEEIDFKVPLMIMGFVWVVTIFYFILFFSLFKGVFPAEALSFLFFIFIIVFIIGLIGVLIKWLAISGVLYVFSSFFKGEGSFKRVMEFSSYGFLPYIVDTFVSYFYVWKIFSSLDLVNLLENVSREELKAILVKEIYIANFYPTLVLTFFSIAMSLCSVYIIIYGIKNARKLTQKDAIIAVSIPAFIYAIYFVVSQIVRLLEIY